MIKNDPIRQVPIARTALLQSEIESVLAPLKSGWLVQGPFVKKFEEKWCEYTKAPHANAVTSCTAGLHLALLAAGVGRGDEVIVPAFTWISTANVVELVGARVVFCDIDLRTFNIDVAAIEALITEKTKAIIPVHLFGLAADMNPILDLAKAHGLFVVEDAACGFGATYEGQHVGYHGDVGVFSFHPRKAVTTGEGGMVTSRSEELSQKIARLRDHGAMVSDIQRHLGPKPYLLADHSDAGMNQRMTDIQGALGAAQMDRAQEIVDERVVIAQRYNAAFEILDWLQCPISLPGFGHGYQSYACLLAPEKIESLLKRRDYAGLQSINFQRNKWMEELQGNGISTRPATHSVHMLSFYKNKYGVAPEDFPNAMAANNCSISLPLFHGLLQEEQEHVIENTLNANPL